MSEEIEVVDGLEELRRLRAKLARVEAERDATEKTLKTMNAVCYTARVYAETLREAIEEGLIVRTAGKWLARESVEDPAQSFDDFDEAFQWATGLEPEPKGSGE